MTWDFFVLESNGLFDKQNDEYGVTPVVFMIPQEDIFLAEVLAKKAGNDFIEERCDRDLEEIFCDYLQEKKIAYHFVGSIKLPYEERQREDLFGAIHHCRLVKIM